MYVCSRCKITLIEVNQVFTVKWQDILAKRRYSITQKMTLYWFAYALWHTPVILITLYLPSWLVQETTKERFGLRVKLPPTHLSTTHGRTVFHTIKINVFLLPVIYSQFFDINFYSLRDLTTLSWPQITDRRVPCYCGGDGAPWCYLPPFHARRANHHRQLGEEWRHSSWSDVLKGRGVEFLPSNRYQESESGACVLENRWVCLFVRKFICLVKKLPLGINNFKIPDQTSEEWHRTTFHDCLMSLRFQTQEKHKIVFLHQNYM